MWQGDISRSGDWRRERQEIPTATSYLLRWLPMIGSLSARGRKDGKDAMVAQKRMRRKTKKRIRPNADEAKRLSS